MIFCHELIIYFKRLYNKCANVLLTKVLVGVIFFEKTRCIKKIFCIFAKLYKKRNIKKNGTYNL